MTTDYERLLAACAAHYEEDTPFLMLADEVQDTDPDRAELIRVQCELAREMAPYPGWRVESLDLLCPMGDREAQTWKHRVQRLNGRAHELLRERAHRWFDDRANDYVAVDYHDGRDVPPSCLVMGKEMPPRVCSYATVDRGFITRVEVRTFEELYTTTRSHVIRYSDSPFYNEMCVHCRATDASGTSLLRGPCVERTEPSPWLRALLTATPERALIREVFPRNLAPWEDHEHHWSWSGTELPYVIRRPDLGPYPTHDGAVTAMGRSIVTWARECIYKEKSL